MSRINTSTLECGLTVITETIPNVRSVAINWHLPIGAAADPAEGEGWSTLLSELLFRGAGGTSSREHSDALDRQGVQRSSEVSIHHLRLQATLLGDRLEDALPLLTMMVREPALAAESLDPVRRLCLQSLLSLPDDPQHLVMLQLAEQHLPPPFNRHGYGEQEALERATIDDLRNHWRARCTPRGSILAVAGDVDADALLRQLDKLLAGWSGEAPEPVQTGPAARGYVHSPMETAQVHLALAYDAPPEPHDDAILERLATSVLSGSTSGRLFTEVRQKRSLCYSVGASYRPGRDFGLVALYAGTTPERAQQTLDVCMSEINRLRDGATHAEFDRTRNGLKSRLIRSGESTASRSSALALDQFRLGRARSLDEIAAAIDRVTLDDLNEYVATRDFGSLTVRTIGPAALEVQVKDPTGATG